MWFSLSTFLFTDVLVPYETLILSLCSAGLPINVKLQGASEIEKGCDQS